MVVAVGLFVGSTVGAAAAPVPTAPVTLDFSAPGQGVFDQSFFVGARRGVHVGRVRGVRAGRRRARPGTGRGRFARPVSALSVSLAPAYAGTAEYTLDALNSSGKRVGRARTTVVQDAGDPATGPFGYFTMQLGSLRGATAFRLSTRLISSSSPNITLMELGLASLTFTPARCAR